MPDLFFEQSVRKRNNVRPLADRLRPTTLEEIVGQEHILGKGMLLRRMIAGDTASSLLFWGAPGTGKTTFAHVIAHESSGHVETFNAAMIGVQDVRRIIEESKKRIEQDNGRTTLFLDEIHRFSRSQQDVLLEAVEQGILILIGATTENPSYSVNNALISRSTVFRLEPLSEENIVAILTRALHDKRGYGLLQLKVCDTAIQHWAKYADGDARRALNALEVAAGSTEGTVTFEIAQQSMQRKAIRYDKLGDGHYDHASALIKSVRAGKTDAALYWLASMLEAGEDPRFIARRMSIFASEDIGLADPRALEQAAAAWLLVERIGMPECQLTLSQLIVYLSKSPKSRSVNDAILQARDDIAHKRTVLAPCDHDANALPTITANYYHE